MKDTFRNQLAAPWGLVFALLSLCTGLSAEEPPNILDLPRMMREQTVDRIRGVKLLKAGERQQALQVFQRSAERMPHDPVAHYNLACTLALLGQAEPALESLDTAIACGFRARETLEKEPDFASLRPLPRFTELLAACDMPPPQEVVGWKYSVKVAQPSDGILKLEPANMTWNQAGNVLQVFVDLSKAGEGKPISGAHDKVGKLLTQWFAEGSAAGNLGDLYDNHDQGHSPLNASLFPQLTRIAYSEAIHKRQFDTGLQNHFLYTDAELADAHAGGAEKGAGGAATNPAGKSLHIERAVVLGNSSTALTGSPMWRSMPRLGLTTTGGADLLVQHYLNNHLYVYPEHRDHDPGHDAKNGWGDVFFVNTPYYVTSQGSSGTDQPFLQAFAATLAALPKDIKEQLRAAGLLAPTLQMIFRRCNRDVQSDKDYLSGVAHPTVFEGADVDAERMVRMAHDLRLDEVPPVVMLKVESEPLGDVGKDYFDAEPAEVVMTTPCAIARLGCSTQYWHEMQVSASAYGQVKGTMAEFQWVILRGDPERIEIKAVDGQPNSRLVRVGYHPRRPVGPGSAIESNRVDIGVFAYNGHNYSAPSFLSFYFPDNEIRQYDAQHRIRSVDYVRAAANYADPALVPQRDWRDEYHYGSDGALTGWTRIRGKKSEEFNAAGDLIVPGEAAADSPKTHRVHYERVAKADGLQSVKQVVDAER